MLSHPTRGFSLIEVVVAIAILATMIVATSALLQRMPINGREVRDQDLALKIARNEIETLRAGGYAALPASGPFVNSLLASLSSGSGSLVVSVYDAKTKQVDVTVSWVGTAVTPRSVVLTTLLAETSGLP
ncbi:MAG: type II secretion system protein [Minisyncoccia bacterium]